MTEDFTMIFNGDEAARLSTNGESASQVDSSIDIEALYNEMQRNMMESQNPSDEIIVDDSRSSISTENFTSFKALKRDDSKISDTDHKTVDTNTDQACSLVTVQDQQKTVEFPQNCQIPIDSLGQESAHPQLDQSSLSDNHQNHVADNIIVVDFAEHCKFDVADQTYEARPNEMVAAESNETVKADPNQMLLAVTMKEEFNSILINDTTAVSLTSANSSKIPLTDNQAILSLNSVDGTEPTLKINDEPNLIDIPNNCQITILGTNRSFSHSVEPLIPSEQGVYNLYECSTCKALFRDKDIYENHVTKAHDFTCAFCTEPCEGKEALENHIVQHISESERFGSVHTSNLNESSFQNNGSLDDNHIPVSKKRKTVMRDNFCQTEELAEDKSDENDEETNEASIIEKESNYPFKRMKYELQFSCKECGKNFDTEGSLQLHWQRSHREEFKCTVCLAIFASKIALQNHLLKHMQNNPKTFQCSVCEERFSTASKLRQHRYIHNLPFHCHICSAQYKVSSALLSHLKKLHPDAKKFFCTECDNSFRIKEYLEAHISEVHKSERKKCQYCSRTFKSYEYLLNHIQEVHPREESKNFDCDYCHSTFDTSTKLKQHMAEKHLHLPYECDQCLNSYATDAELRDHKQAEHPISHVYHCDSCSRSFSFKNHLDIHTSVFHHPKNNIQENKT